MHTKINGVVNGVPQFSWLPRLVLLLYLASGLHCTWLVEQPSGSERVFSRHHRFEHFCNTVSFAACPTIYPICEPFWCYGVIKLYIYRYCNSLRMPRSLSSASGWCFWEWPVLNPAFAGATTKLSLLDWTWPQFLASQQFGSFSGSILQGHEGYWIRVPVSFRTVASCPRPTVNNIQLFRPPDFWLQYVMPTQKYIIGLMI